MVAARSRELTTVTLPTMLTSSLDLGQDQHRYHYGAIAARMIMMQVSCICSRLVHMGQVDRAVVLKLEDEDGPVRKNDYIGTTAPLTRQLILEYDMPLGGPRSSLNEPS